MFLHAHSKDSDQTGRMLRLICVFAGFKGHFVGFCHKAAQICSHNAELLSVKIALFENLFMYYG